MHWDLGGYRPKDIRVVAAWDVDRRKVGRDVQASSQAQLHRGVLRSCADRAIGRWAGPGRRREHMAEWPTTGTFLLADARRADRRGGGRALLRDTRRDVLVNYLPVGSRRRRILRRCALRRGRVRQPPRCSSPASPLGERFGGVRPIIGDDIKAQLGATIVHRVLTDLFSKRGSSSTDVPAQHRRQHRLCQHGQPEPAQVQEDQQDGSCAVGRGAPAGPRRHPYRAVRLRRVAERQQGVFPPMEGQLFGGVPMNLELRLSVEDSPNSAGVAIDMIRCAKIARDRGLGGVVHPASAYFCKHPPEQTTDDLAHDALEAWIAG
jgi:myo-inositol-1-phosphate synthase